MSLSPLDSPLWAGLYGDEALAELLGDEALLAGMVRVEVALAEACAAADLVPEKAARAIAETLSGYRPDPAVLADRTARDGVPVPALVAELRRRLPGDAAAALHYGATSQDIVDSATALALIAALDEIERRISRLALGLAALAREEAETVMAARTRSQIGLPTTFGALVAIWGYPLIDGAERFASLRPRIARLSMHGAVGSSAAFGTCAGTVRAHAAEALGLAVDDRPGHAQRDGIAELGSAAVLLSASLGKIGLDVATLTQSGIAELRIRGGASSTMPHKSNPVAAEALVALARHSAHLQASLFAAVIHGQFRDGSAWALEWMSLRPILVATGAALRTAQVLIDGLRPDHDRMRTNLAAEGFGPFAEAAVFSLATRIPRPEAEAEVKRALSTVDPAATLAERFDWLDRAALTDPSRALGQAPDQSRAFADRCDARFGAHA